MRDAVNPDLQKCVMLQVQAIQVGSAHCPRMAAGSAILFNQGVLQIGLVPLDFAYQDNHNLYQKVPMPFSKKARQRAPDLDS